MNTVRHQTTAAEWLALALLGAAVLAFVSGVLALTARLANDPHPWSFGTQTMTK
jgi:hypothetical protein